MTEPAGVLPLPAAAAEPTPQAVEQAIAWAVKMHYGTPDDATRRAFEHWLAADAGHAAAWRRVQAMTAELRELPRQLARDTLQARQALRHRRRRALKYLGLAAAAGLPAWMAGRHAPWQRLVADASTATGQRRTVRLADGSTVSLNTDTAIASRMDAGQRRLVLLRGEIFVATGPDLHAAGKRPFWVETPHGRLQALGTEFLVRLHDDAARVGVRKGAVAMHPRHAAASATARPGQQWLMRDDAIEPAGQAAFEAGGWLDGVIVARSMPLAAFLAELGRYRSGYLAADPRIADLPLTGIYQIQDTDRTLRFLARAQGLRLVYRSRYWVTVAPAGA